MYKTTIFDLGNVILQVDFTPFVQWVADNSQEKDLDRIRAFHRSSLYYEFEFGSIKVKEFIRRMEKIFYGSFPEQEFIEKFCSVFPGVITNMGAVLKELVEQRNVFCLTNTNPLHFEYLMQSLPEMQLFTKIFASHQLKYRKPYPGTYKEVEKNIQTPNTEIIYFDDLQHNVLAAQKMGWEAHVFENSEQVKNLCFSTK